MLTVLVKINQLKRSLSKETRELNQSTQKLKAGETYLLTPIK